MKNYILLSTGDMIICELDAKIKHKWRYSRISRGIFKSKHGHEKIVADIIIPHAQIVVEFKTSGAL